MAADRAGGASSAGIRLLIALAAAMLAGSGFILGTQILSPSVSYDLLPPPQPAQTGLPSAWSSSAVPGATPLDRSVPVHIDIPRIGVHAGVMQVGTNPDGTVAVPSEDQADLAAWYTGSATPGQTGPSVILAHVDSRALPHGRAAFYPLGAARKGEEVDVTREDHTMARFKIDAVTLILKKDFPTQAVYGPTTTPALRLITCGGTFTASGGYSSNVVVFAHYIGSYPAP